MFLKMSFRVLCPALLAAACAVACADNSTSAPRSLGNPIRPYDSADPGIVLHDGKWYLYHTGRAYADGGRYPIAMSPDLTTWTVVGSIFNRKTIPDWCSKSLSWWAPEVHKVNNKYIAYYTARQNDSNRFAVGAAVGDKPEGPFIDIGKPLKANEKVGLIDVTYFEDPNTRKKYLLWKEDQNDFNPPRPTPIVMQELSSDGVKVIGTERELIRNDQPWEGVLVEAPTVVFRNGWYYLFYSGNIFVDDGYSVGVARSRNVWGPYEKDPKPILVHDEHFSGPAHQFVMQDEQGNWRMFYHARVKSIDSRRRFLMNDYLTWTPDGWPRVNDGHPGPPSKKVLREINRLHEEYARRGRDDDD